jgi:hypothetical protein
MAIKEQNNDILLSLRYMCDHLLIPFGLDVVVVALILLLANGLLNYFDRLTHLSYMSSFYVVLRYMFGQYSAINIMHIFVSLWFFVSLIIILLINISDCWAAKYSKNTREHE